MFFYEREMQIGQDRQDLIEILYMRFGQLPPELEEQLYTIEDYETIDRLILVAANVPTLSLFIEEMYEGNRSFKLVGERFNPVAHLKREGDSNDR
ncbi:hypothetical protein ACFOZ1_03610 [Gracilibacillus marinus]|jgi:hypothetical protein|uniref:Uncharacterized protein n=1 Tax=Gracilibacillus marinus TaxID=630535 RepID=A0ABV8VV06_9BACI